MKIFVVLPGAEGVYPPEAEKRRIDRIMSYARPGVEISVGFPAARSGFNPYGGGGTALAVAQNHILMAERIIQAEKEGFDACFPFGMVDFGVDLARASCTIPIVGQAQAAYCVAAMMATRVGTITYQSQNHDLVHRQLREFGLSHLLAGLGASEIPNNEMPLRREELFERFVSEGKRLVKEGAELIVCHGMSMSPIEFPAKEYADAIGVPVLEGVGCALVMCEAWVNLGTPYSPVRYPR